MEVFAATSLLFVNTISRELNMAGGMMSLREVELVTRPNSSIHHRWNLNLQLQDKCFPVNNTP